MSTNPTLLSAPMRQSGWRQGCWPSSAGAWAALVLILLALGLLWTFYQVTRAIVQQSELRLQRISIYNKATWHCNGLRDPVTREHCLLQRKVLAGELSASLP